MDQPPAAPAPPRIALYARVSLEEQAREGYSIPHQQETLRRHVALLGGVEAGLWTDVESGRHDGRAGYQALLAAARQWDVLLVWRVDRLGRDAAELFRVARELRKAGKRLLSVTENVDDPFVMGLHFLLAEREAWLIGERVRPITLKLASEGRHVSRPPAPYRMQDKRLTVDPAERAIYLEIVERVEAGESIRAICHDLNGRGLRTRRGSLYRPSQVAGLLRNPLHAGLIRRKGLREPVRGQHEPVIALERWQRLQARLDEARLAASLRRPAAGRPPPAWLLTGFIRCDCGGAMVHRRRRYQRWQQDYYVCNRQKLAGVCSVGRAVRCEAAHAAVEEFLTPLFRRSPAELADDAGDWLAQQRPPADSALARRRARLEADIQRARDRLARLVDDLADRVIGPDDYHAARARYQADLAAASAALAALPAPALPDLDREELVERADLLVAFGETWQAAGLDDRRALLRLLGLRATRTAGGLRLCVAPEAAPFLPERLFPL